MFLIEVRTHLQLQWREQVEGRVCWSEDGDGVRAGESLHQAGRSDCRDEAGEGRVDRQGVEDRAGEAAGPGRDLELQAGRGGGPGWQEGPGRPERTAEGSTETSEWKLRLGISQDEADRDCDH